MGEPTGLVYTRLMASDSSQSSPTELRRRARIFRPWALLTTAALIALSLARPAVAAEASTITLRDGSAITAEILSLNDGVYTVRSQTLGTVTLRQEDVRSVSSEAAAQAPSQLDAIEQRMTSDPETMSTISALQDSPEMKALLEDPEVLDALKSGNIQGLLSNPKLARLAADPRIQEITKKYAE